MSVLCVVAHPDDEVIGVGGTLARHVDEGDSVDVCVLSNGVTSRHDETNADVRAEIDRRRQRTREACDTIGVSSVETHNFPDQQFDTVALLEIVKTIEKAIETYEPETIYTHHFGDLNVDHRLTSRAVVTAARPLPDSDVCEVLAFETLSASEWSVPNTVDAFQPTAFVSIEKYVETKIAAVEAYEDELREPPHPRSIETIRENASVWGSKAGLTAAEPFVHLREIRR